MILVLCFLHIPGNGLANTQPHEAQPPVAEKEAAEEELDLANIIPSGTQLNSHLADLRNHLRDVLDIYEIERDSLEINTRLNTLADQFEQLKASKDYTFNKLVTLRNSIYLEKESLEKIEKILINVIHQLEALRKDWLSEKQLWHKWQSSLLHEGESDQIRSTFIKVNNTLDTALGLILPKLDSILKLQEKTSDIHLKMETLSTDLNALILVKRSGITVDKSPPMLSLRYLSQFSGELGYAVQQGLDEISWPNRKFFLQNEWILLLQVFLFFLVIITIYRNRQILNQLKYWRFLFSRPFSTGLFLSFIPTLLIYTSGETPATWELLCISMGAISFARLTDVLVEKKWKIHFVYCLVVIIISTKLLYVVNLPLPFFRLYMLLTALAGLLLFWHWARESILDKDPGFYASLLRWGSLIFIIIILAELWGKQALSENLFSSSMASMGLILTFQLLIYIIHGALEWILRVSPLQRVKLIQNNVEEIFDKISRFIDLAMWGLVIIPAILMIWGAYGSLEDALKGLLELGFNVGSQRISVGLLLISAVIMYGSFLISWIFEQILLEEDIFSHRMERGVRISIARLIHYLIIFIAFLMLLSILGIDVTKLTILLSAFGIGIGFGLQAIVNNFVSGLILLFERPIRVGDYIDLDGKWAEVKTIGLRATTVQTFDLADQIIPNADLITGKVTNWTLSNRRVGIIIAVGVAYGSDVSLVMEKLMATAKANPMVVDFPAPKALFLNFGESSLDFELRVWVVDVNQMLKVKSELHQEIDRIFKEAHIEVSFPQLDLHLRSQGNSLDPQKNNASS